MARCEASRHPSPDSAEAEAVQVPVAKQGRLATAEQGRVPMPATVEIARASKDRAAPEMDGKDKARVMATVTRAPQVKAANPAMVTAVAVVAGAARAAAEVA